MQPRQTTRLGLTPDQLRGYPCVRLDGEGDGASAARLRAALHRLVEHGHMKLMLDVRGLRFFDLHCSEVLEEFAEQFVGAGGSLVLIDDSLPLERALKYPDLEELVYVAPTPTQAAACLDRLP
jgi:anti-anti-sigma factor